jgi:hypothetical protein
VTRREYDWAFGFGDDQVSGLAVGCPWRILTEDRIAFTNGDDGHQFGLPAPLDGEEATRRLLGQRPIERVLIRSETGDLSIVFSGKAILEVFNMSSGYEGWQIGIPGMNVIATGGGELAIYGDTVK